MFTKTETVLVGVAKRQERNDIVRDMKQRLEALLQQPQTREVEAKYDEVRYWIARLGGCILVCFIASTAQATPILLAELSYNQPEPVTLPADYTLYTGDNEGNVFWTDTVSSFPFESHASGEMFTRLNEVLTGGNSDNSLGVALLPLNDDKWPDTNPNVDTWGDCFVCAFKPLFLLEHLMTPQEVAAVMESVGLSATLHVPYLGPRNLMGYTLTDVERIVTAEGQTIRFFGEVAPEPASWLIVLCAGCFQWRKRR